MTGALNPLQHAKFNAQRRMYAKRVNIYPRYKTPAIRHFNTIQRGREEKQYILRLLADDIKRHPPQCPKFALQQPFVSRTGIF